MKPQMEVEMKKSLQVFVIIVLALALVFTVFAFRNAASPASVAEKAPQSISGLPITVLPPVGIPTPPPFVPMVGWNS